MAQLLHLLAGRNTGHRRDIVIVQAFGMLLDQVENIFFICLLSHKDSTHKNVRSQ